MTGREGWKHSPLVPPPKTFPHKQRAEGKADSGSGEGTPRAPDAVGGRGVGPDARGKPFNEGSGDRHPSGQRVGVPGLGHGDLSLYSTERLTLRDGGLGGRRAPPGARLMPGLVPGLPRRAHAATATGCTESTAVLRALEATQRKMQLSGADSSGGAFLGRGGRRKGMSRTVEVSLSHANLRTGGAWSARGALEGRAACDPGLW